MTDKNVLRGPPLVVPNCSMAEYVLPKLKSLPKNHVLLVDGETGESRTSWQLLTESVHLLKGLKALGLRQNDTVGLLCRNSFEANEIILASWLGVFPIAPINGFMKVLELKYTFELLKPKILFCEEAMADNAAAAAESLTTPPFIVVVDKSKTSQNSYRAFKDLKICCDVDNFQASPVESPSSQILLIPPSSGTTGLPKGIGQTHTNLIYMDKVIEITDLYPRDLVMVQTSQFYWMTGILAFIRSASVGMKRVFFKEYTPEIILSAIDKYKANFAIMAPLTLLSLTTSPKFRQYDLSSIKFVSVTGSLLKEATAKNIMVVDLKTGASLPVNKSGEICMRSLGVMKGYIGMEEETTATIDADGWIHTGDVGYYDDSGKVYIVDRIKEIIKVSGMQVSPAEIENVIESIPGVSSAGVIGIPQPDDTILLMGMVVKKKGSNLKEEDISSFIESQYQNLSEYKKLTAGVYFVEAIPQTPSGKISRGQLKVMAQKLQSCNLSK
ncbi:hypothetical protein RUM43_002335 [Polyplax serrata]|uniref:Uncharacterized protein n=1 Tax=Polyplax serrata TaxID=468196 RepID=A0AAN8S2L5_POLSC